MPSLVENVPVVLKFSIMKFSILQLSPFWEGRDPKFENNLNHLHPRMLCQVWLKLARWFWRRRFLKVVNLFLLFPNYLPFGKGVVLLLNKLESPSPGNTLCQVWLKLAQWFWRRRWKCEKFTDRWAETDDRWSEKLTWAFSSGELKMKTTIFKIHNLNRKNLFIS